MPNVTRDILLFSMSCSSLCILWRLQDIHRDVKGIRRNTVSWNVPPKI